MRQEAMHLTNERKPVSFITLLRAMAGCGLAALVFFGVIASSIGLNPDVTGSIAAVVGALVGAFFVLRG